MASGRVGGTKSKISGSVGSLTFKIVPNGDGTYTQIVGEKKQIYTQTKTSRLAVQQMCTAIVETMMKSLKNVLSYSFQSAANKSKSLNAFSTFNLAILAQDCRQHWYEQGDFYYPLKKTFEPVCGPFLLSSGTLPYSCFKSLGYFSDPRSWGYALEKESGIVNLNGSAVYFEIPANGTTIADFMKYNHLTQTSVIFIASHVTFEHHDDKTDEDYQSDEWIYAKISINPQVSSKSKISETVLISLFGVDGSYSVGSFYCPKAGGILVGLIWEDRYQSDQVNAHGAFSIDYVAGRKLIQSSKIIPAGISSWPIIRGFTPARSLHSWMGEPYSGDWPYPW